MPSLKILLSDERLKISKERLAICETCEFFVNKTTKCEKCGCFMEYKSLMLSQECPIGKWGKEGNN